MKFRQIVMITSSIILLLLLNFYIGLHTKWFIDEWWPNSSVSVFWILFTVISFAYLIGFIPWPAAIRPLARLFKVIGSYYLAVMEFALILLPLTDLLYGILIISKVETSNFTFIAGVLVVSIIIILLLWGSRNAWSTIVRKHEIIIKKQAGNRSTLRIAVASDLHLGNIVGKRHLKRMVKKMNRMEPDLILLVGDVLDDSIEPFIRNHLSDTMKELKAKLGVFAVLGNHEYYGKSIKQYVDIMNQIGIRVLQDEIVNIEDSFYIVGRKDKTAHSMDPNGRKSVASLFEELDRTRPIIMMDHQPYAFNLAAEAGTDLLLSGHTHRGQFFPNHWVTRRMYELDWGYLFKNPLHVIVSSGFGTWGPPIRLASRSELIEIKITFSSY